MYAIQGTTDSDQLYSIRSPKAAALGRLPLDAKVNDWQKEALKMQNENAEEMADELQEDVDYSDCFQDARSLFEAASDMSDRLTATSIATEGHSNFGEDMAVIPNESLNMKENLKGDWVIPIYQGEVILPHPGKMPVSAWMYPIQMISIPSTEVAFEKGWEPGGNKYTLYSIHVSI